ncbi:MAG: type II secretion system protein [Alphaproteobacteria bacterium]
MNVFKKEVLGTSFSLLELSIVLTIVAIISGAVISVAGARNDAARIIQTKNKLDLIETALAAFVRLNLRLPCPADITLYPNSTNPNYGIENCGGGNLILSSSFPTGFTCPSNYIAKGMIPFQTLNLPREFGVDGWGNKIVYSVSRGFTANAASNYGTPTLYSNDTFSGCNMGLNKINGISSTSRTDQAVYVLVSHGANGYGAYPEGNSAANIASSDSNEITNYTSASQTFVHMEPTSSFDDIVRYKMKWQVIKEAGGVVANQACIYAKTVVETSDLVTSGNYYNPYCKSQPSSQDCDSTITTLANIVLNNLCLNK